jgi:hypothetical protein
LRLRWTALYQRLLSRLQLNSRSSACKDWNNAGTSGRTATTAPLNWYCHAANRDRRSTPATHAQKKLLLHLSLDRALLRPAQSEVRRCAVSSQSSCSYAPCRHVGCQLCSPSSVLPLLLHHIFHAIRRPSSQCRLKKHSSAANRYHTTGIAA